VQRAEEMDGWSEEWIYATATAEELTVLEDAPIWNVNTLSLVGHDYIWQ
jgi:hypothetical protein